jgi:hypothetical protein
MQPVTEKINNYKNKWIQHVCRMEWLLHAILKHQPAGTDQGRPSKRLLDGRRRPEQARRSNSLTALWCDEYFFSVALQSLKDLGRLHTGGLLNYLDIWWDSLDEWSARRKASTYTWQHNTETRGQTSMSWETFEPTIPATNRPRPQTSRPLWPALGLYIKN